MTTFCLVDCDCFYVSAERLFDPTLIGVPVVALSNSDGCVVSRCPIAKSKDIASGGLAIKMGAPFVCVRPSHLPNPENSGHGVHFQFRWTPVLAF